MTGKKEKPEKSAYTLDDVKEDMGKVARVLQDTVDRLVKTEAEVAYAALQSESGGDKGDEGDTTAGKLSLPAMMALNPTDDRLAEFTDNPQRLIIPLTLGHAMEEFTAIMDKDPTSNVSLGALILKWYHKIMRGLNRELMRESIAHAQLVVQSNEAEVDKMRFGGGGLE